VLSKRRFTALFLSLAAFKLSPSLLSVAHHLSYASHMRTLDCALNFFFFARAAFSHVAALALMLRSFFLPVLALLCAFASVGLVNANLALDFTSEIVLENAVLNASFNVTGDFTNSVASILQSSLGASTLSASVYTVYPHLVISTETWYSGTAASVENRVNTINSTYQKLVSDDSVSMDVSGKLSYLCMRNIGQQPTFVDYSNNCSFYDETMPPRSDSRTCMRNLSVSIYTNSSDATAMRAALCSFLPTECDLITNATVSQASVTLGGTAVSVYVMPFTITSRDREATLALLVAYANFASFLVEQKVVYILVDGVRVFYQGNLQQLWTVGTMGQCVQRMWYLIFLIILVPVILILSQQMFYWGRRSGKRSVKKAEADIRAGVSRGMNLWANFGAAGYQYGPPPGYPRNYPGGYPGNEMQQQQQQQQGNSFLQQRGPPQSFYGQQWGGQQYGGPQQSSNPQLQRQQQQQQFGGLQLPLPTLQQQQQQQLVFPPQNQPGSLTKRNMQWSYNGQ
jgi:hypothetical protein